MDNETEAFDPDDLGQRERLAETAYLRSLSLEFVRAAEAGAESEDRYAVSWAYLPRDRQEPFRAAVEALVEVIEFRQG